MESTLDEVINDDHTPQKIDVKSILVDDITTDAPHTYEMGRDAADYLDKDPFDQFLMDHALKGGVPCFTRPSCPDEVIGAVLTNIHNSLDQVFKQIDALINEVTKDIRTDVDAVKDVRTDVDVKAEARKLYDKLATCSRDAFNGCHDLKSKYSSWSLYDYITKNAVKIHLKKEVNDYLTRLSNIFTIANTYQIKILKGSKGRGYGYETPTLEWFQDEFILSLYAHKH
jgi:hypothetical protein